jgi:putative oxidoreductase
MDMYMGWDSVKALPAGNFMVYAGKAVELVAGILLNPWVCLPSMGLACHGFYYVFHLFFIGSGKFWYEDQHPFLFAMLALVFTIFGPGAWALTIKFKKNETFFFNANCYLSF